jgi:hypothetical protein
MKANKDNYKRTIEIINGDEVEIIDEWVSEEQIANEFDHSGPDYDAANKTVHVRYAYLNSRKD